MTVAELGARMSSAELTEWIAYLGLQHDSAQVEAALAEATQSGGSITDEDPDVMAAAWDRRFGG